MNEFIYLLIKYPLRIIDIICLCIYDNELNKVMYEVIKI
jgi:hypothetical protein